LKEVKLQLPTKIEDVAEFLFTCMRRGNALSRSDGLALCQLAPTERISRLIDLACRSLADSQERPSVQSQHHTVVAITRVKGTVGDWKAEKEGEK
jgi:hypothetical protein